MVGRFDGVLTVISETSLTACQTGEHLGNGDLVNHSKDRSFLFGSMVEYHPISAKDPSPLHQFGKKVLPGIFLGCAMSARVSRR